MIGLCHYISGPVEHFGRYAHAKRSEQLSGVPRDVSAHSDLLIGDGDGNGAYFGEVAQGHDGCERTFANGSLVDGLGLEFVGDALQGKIGVGFAKVRQEAQSEMTNDALVGPMKNRARTRLRVACLMKVGIGIEARGGAGHLGGRGWRR